MGYAGTVADVDRLPWLKEERKTAGGRETPWLVGWAVAGIALVAGASYWVGRSDLPTPFTPTAPEQEQTSATLRLPIPAQTPADEPAVPLAAPEPAIPIAQEVARADLPRTVERPVNRVVANPAEPADRATPVEESGAESEDSGSEPVAEKPLTYWPASESEGAAGRIVRVGTFSSRLQAKRAWWKVVKVYPGIKNLKAVVHALPSQRNGRTYYRLQFGTTSQAHSEILCQRMKIVGQSCVVVGVGEVQNPTG